MEIRVMTNNIHYADNTMVLTEIIEEPQILMNNPLIEKSTRIKSILQTQYRWSSV